MTQNNEREAFENLLNQYWNIAYAEGGRGVSQGSKAQEVLSSIRGLFDDRPISQNEQQEAVMKVTSNGSQLSLTRPDGTYWDMSKYIGQHFYTSTPKQIPDGWKLIGKVSEMGVVWHKQNPHAHPVGTEFYAVLPTTSLTSETNTEVGE